MNDDELKKITKKKKKYCKELAALTRKYGFVVGYDTGYATGDELYSVDINNEYVASYLEDLDKGFLEKLNIHYFDEEIQRIF